MATEKGVKRYTEAELSIMSVEELTELVNSSEVAADLSFQIMARPMLAAKTIMTGKARPASERHAEELFSRLERRVSALEAILEARGIAV